MSLIIKEMHPGRTMWVVSFTGSNPNPEDCVVVESQESAISLNSYLNTLERERNDAIKASMIDMQRAEAAESRIKELESKS